MPTDDQMAVVSESTAAEPPEQLRDRLLASLSAPAAHELRPGSARWRTAALGAAGRGGDRPRRRRGGADATPTAGTVHRRGGVRRAERPYCVRPIPTGGTATFVFSRERNAGVLVMNNVAAPAPGSVYQMWLVDDGGAHSAGTMDAQAVAPSTTAVLPDIGTSNALAFPVELGAGSTVPTGPLVAELPLR